MAHFDLLLEVSLIAFGGCGSLTPASWLCSTLGFIPGYDLVCDKSPVSRGPIRVVFPGINPLKLWEDMSGETEPDISEGAQHSTCGAWLHQRP